MEVFGRNHAKAARPETKEPNMSLQNIVSRVRTRLDKQRRYRNAVSEINSLSLRDLADIRANRDDLLYWARKEFLG